MSLKDTLRKAAEVFVDLPDEEPDAARQPGVAASTAEPDAMADIDRRLAEMSQRLAAGSAGLAEGSAEAAGPADAAPKLTLSNTDTAAAVSPAGGAPSAPEALTADGGLDLAALYARAEVPAVPFPAEQALEMIRSLPANLPLDVKRQTVQVTVISMGKAIGATPETIAADAAHKREALAAYAEEVAKQTGDFTQAAEFEIAELERQIEAKRAAIYDAKNRQEQVKRLTDAEAERLNELLGFFGGEPSAV